MKKGKTNILTILLIIAVFGLSITSLTLYGYNQDLKKNQVKTTETPAQKEYKRIKEKVSKLMQIPEKEKFFLGTYESKTKLKENPFFKDAKDNDKYLIFSETGKAIIYRESENKLINVGPIAIATEKKTDKPAQTTDNK